MTRSACEVYVLQHNLKSLKTAGERSLSQAAPTLWNELPFSIRLFASVQFQANIKDKPT